jgi:hypothetical protein
MKFAKLIELENGEQVLACIGIDDSDDGYRLSFLTNVNGVTFKMGLGWDTEEQRNDYLGKFNITFAKQIRTVAEETISEK